MHSPVPAPSTLVGRDRELRILQQHFNAARAGNGGLVLIGGEAGIGKTALAETLCREVMEQDALLLAGRCYDLTETPPYGPWVELFARSPSVDGVPLPAAFSQRGTVGAVTSQAALFQQVLDFLSALSARLPVVLLLDDLHWADPASLDLLRFVARYLATISLLIVATYRTEEVAPRHPLYPLLPLLVRESNAHRLDLHPLDETALQAILVMRYHLSAPDAGQLSAYLQARAEGNALFIGELLRSLEETGGLRCASERWHVGDLDAVAIPPLLRQVIDSRVARLGVEAGQLLRIAAVITEPVPVSVWAAVSETDEDTLADLIEQASGARLLDETEDGTAVRFAHALIRDTLYASIAAVRRRRVHLRAGEVLAATPNPDPDTVANHFQRAGDARAVEWLITAGRRAHRLWARFTAQERYEAALALMGGTNPAARGALLYRLARLMMFVDAAQAMHYQVEAYQLAIGAEDAALVANLLFLQGELRILTGDVRRGLTDMVEATRMLNDLTSEEHERFSRLEMIEGTDAERATGMLLMWLGVSGRYDEVRARDMQRRVPVPSLALTSAALRSGYGHRGLLMTHAALGQPVEAEREYQLARAAFVADSNTLATNVGLNAMDALQFIVVPYQTDDVVERARLATEAEQAFGVAGDRDTLLAARPGRLPVLIVEGEWEEARAVAEAVLTNSGQGYLINSARHYLTPLAYHQGDDARAWQLIREMLPGGVESAPDDAAWYQSALVMQHVAVMLSLDAGDLPTAHAWLTAHDRWLAWSGTVLGRSEGQELWAHYYRQSGDTELADAHAQRALTLAREPRQPLALLAAHRLLGSLATDNGHFDEAVIHLEEALTLADACAAPYERALTLLGKAELHTAKDERADALGLLDAVREICTPLGAQPALGRVEALTTRLRAAQSPPPAYPAGLSAREVDVLRLIAAGKTNREIAEILFLSEHTVHIHVRHIYQKTRTDNRAAATAFALRRGLA